MEEVNGIADGKLVRAQSLDGDGRRQGLVEPADSCDKGMDDVGNRSDDEPPLWMDAGHCDGRSRKSRTRRRGSAKQPWENIENSWCRHASSAKTR